MRFLSALLVLSFFFPAALAGDSSEPYVAGPAGLEVASNQGNLRYSRSDLQVPGPGLSLDLGFTYNSQHKGIDRGYGNGWTFNYNISLEVIDGSVTVHWGDGSSDTFRQDGDGYAAPAGVFDTLVGRGGKYTLTSRDGTSYAFHSADHNRLTRITDRNGNQISLSYSDGLPVSITDSAGRAIELVFAEGRLTSLVDGNAKPTRAFSYFYDGKGNMVQVLNPMEQMIEYAYDASGALVQLTDARGKSSIINYDGDTVASIEGMGTYLGFAYYGEQTQVSGSDGEVFATYNFDAKGRCIDQSGRVKGLARGFVYDADDNLISDTDGSGNTVTQSFNDRGDRLSRTDALGAQEKFSYDDAYGVMTSFTDRANNTYTFGLDSKGNRTSVVYPNGVTETFTFNSRGQVLTHTDGDGDLYSYTYNANGDLTSAKDAMGSTTYGYDGVGNKTSETDALGNTTTFAYDALNRLITVTDPEGYVTSYGYDANGNLTSITDGDGNTTTFTYNARNLLKKRTLPEGNSVTLSYDERGNIIRKVDGEGHVYDYAFNTAGQAISEKVTAYDVSTLPVQGTVIGKTTQAAQASSTLKTYSYNPNGTLASFTTATGATTVIIYNGNNWPLQTLFPDGTANTYTYTPNGSPKTVTTPNGNTTTFTYNGNNQVISVSDNHGSFFSYSYTGSGQISSASDGDGGMLSYTFNAKKKPLSRTDAMGQSASYSYNAAGHMTSATNRNGVVTQYTYDSNGRVLSETSGGGNTLSRTYDASGDITSKTDAENQTTTYTYDGNGRNTQITFPDGAVKSFIFDGNDNITSRTDTNGNTISYIYDAQNRLIGRNYPGGNNDVFTYDASGNMLSATNNNAAVTFTYDSNGRMTSESINGLTTSYSYDIANGRVTSTYPSGKAITNVFDGRGRLDQVLDGLNIVTDYTYSTMGDISRQDFGNGTSVDRTTNGNYLTTSLTHQPGAFAAFNYTYDNEFYIQTAEKGHRPFNSQKYTYDLDNQLTGYEEGLLSGGQIPSPVRYTNYTYDNNHNRTGMNWSGVAVNYIDNALSQYTNISYLSVVINPVHDANGNQIWDGTNGYGYDAENRMTSVNGGATASYLYDSFGRRVSKVTPSGTTNYYYAGQRVIEERDGQGNLEANYIYGYHLDEVLRMDRGGQSYYYHRDNAGSIIALTDNTGTVVERYEYTAYGLPSIFDGAFNSIGGSAVDNPYMFTGRRYETETGLYYYRARHYDSIHGRFLQRDPYGYIDSMNVYAYVRNNPINYVDPTGEWLGALVGAVVGAVVGGVTAAVTGGDVVAGAVGGAVTGALVGSGVPPAAAGAVGGAVSGAISGGKKGGVGGAVAGAAVGAVAGAATGAVAGGISTAVAGEGFAAGAASSFTTGAANTATTVGGALGEALKGAAAPSGHAATVIVGGAQLYYVDLPIAIYKAGTRIIEDRNAQIDDLLQQIEGH